MNIVLVYKFSKINRNMGEDRRICLEFTLQKFGNCLREMFTYSLIWVSFKCTPGFFDISPKLN